MSLTKDAYDSHVVQYRCSCNIYSKISKLYFCRHCFELRCGNCVSHEVDSFFCPNCVENIPSTEAKNKKYRCMNCCMCPSCKHILVPRAASILVPAPDDTSKTIPKKVYFLTCGFCRWTSRDVGIPDQPTATGGWPDLEHPHAKRIESLVEHYRGVSLKEKAEKDKKDIRRSKYMHLMSKSSLYGSGIRRSRSSLYPPGLGSKEVEIKDLDPVEAQEEIEELSSDFFDNVCLTSVTNLTQRHLDPNFQRERTQEMYPRHIGLLIKRSQRCKVCEHNLIKPEFNPTSIKFKIQLSAYYHVPEIRIMKIPELVYQQATKLLLTLCNPTQHELEITVTGNNYNSENPDPEITSDLVTPSCVLKIPRKDVAAEFDDEPDNQKYKDDPEIVTYRKANKIGFCCYVTPRVEFGTVTALLTMKYDCVNSLIVLPHAEPKEPQIVPVTYSVRLNLGNIKN